MSLFAHQTPHISTLSKMVMIQYAVGKIQSLALICQASCTPTFRGRSLSASNEGYSTFGGRGDSWCEWSCRAWYGRLRGQFSAWLIFLLAGFSRIPWDDTVFALFWPVSDLHLNGWLRRLETVPVWGRY